MIAADETGRPRFYDLLLGTRAPTYVAFDILWLNGSDLRSLPLHERRRALQSIVPKGSAIVSEALSVEGRGRELFDLMCANDLEGIVAKRLVDPYDTRVTARANRSSPHSSWNMPDYCDRHRRPPQPLDTSRPAVFARPGPTAVAPHKSEFCTVP